MSSGTKKFLMAKPILIEMEHAGANEQGVLCVRFVATRDDGQAAHARADVPELVLAAKHAPGCAAAFKNLFAQHPRVLASRKSRSHHGERLRTPLQSGTFTICVLRTAESLHLDS